jgi:hypothetical protein
MLMRNEQELCTILRNSLTWAYKIPDPMNNFGSVSQKPFDIFGILSDKPVYIEAKYANHFKAFDLSRIEDHQIANLRAIKALIPDAHCWIVYGVRVDRGDNRIFIFDNPHEINKRREEKRNFLKKELENLPYYPVRKGIIDLTNLIGGCNVL